MYFQMQQANKCVRSAWGLLSTLCVFLHSVPVGCLAKRHTDRSSEAIQSSGVSTGLDIQATGSKF